VSWSSASKLWLIAALFVQTAFAPWLTVHGVVPSFVTIVVVLGALRGGVRSGLILAAIAGVLTDAVSASGGGWTFAYLAVGLGAGAARSRFFGDGIVLPSVIVGVAIVVRNAIFWAIATAEGYPRGYGIAHVHAALEQAALTALVAALVQAVRLRFADPARTQRFA
jgi:rod shape-determining protein MreD